MSREIFVVARDRPDLYRYLSQTFEEAENVQVILDRRSGEGAARADDRRARPKVDEELRSVGYALITMP
jgi:hypothetical protein